MLTSIKHTVSARLRLMRRRIKRRVGIAVPISLACGCLFNMVECWGYAGTSYRRTGIPHSLVLWDIWWHFLPAAAFIFVFYVLWPFPITSSAGRLED